MTVIAPDKSKYRRFWNAQQATNMNSAARAFLGTTGAALLDFGGGNADDDEAAWTFQVPENYIDNGQFYVRATSPATGSVFQLEMDISMLDVGDRADLANDGGLQDTAVGPDVAWEVIEFGPFIPSAAVLEAGKTGVVRINRDASDSPDTATNITLSVLGLILQYRGA